MPTIPPRIRPIDLTTQAQALAEMQGSTIPSLRQRIQDAWEIVTGRAFGPGKPMEPTISNASHAELPPRQFQYPMGMNQIISPRREQPGLTPFEQLRNLAALYDVAAMCIATRIEEMQGMSWSVAAKDKKQQAALQNECDEVTTFFQQPDKLNDFHAWLGMLLYELFTTDAMTLYKRLDQGEQLYALEPVDGTTIKPLLDARGRTVAYQQIVYGFVESDYLRPSAKASDERFPQFSSQELLYRPRWTRAFTPYGFPPTEWIILRVNTALRKQTFDLAWFTDGNIPDMIATAPEGSNLSPEQVQNFEVWFNAVLEGDDKSRRKVRFVPWNMNFEPLKEFQYNTDLDEWMLRVTCAAYSVPPQELGFTYEMNRATAEMQEAVNERRGLKPLANWLKATIFDPIIRDNFGRESRLISLPGTPTRQTSSLISMIEWQWHFGDRVDLLTQAQSDQLYISSGVISPDEVRIMRFGDTLDGPAPGPPMIPEVGLPIGAGSLVNIPPMTANAPIMDIPHPAKVDLKLWREKAVKAVKARKPATFAFASQSIPDGLQRWITRELEKADKAGGDLVEEVRDVFTRAAAPEVAARFFRLVSVGEVGWEDYG